jgi:hypothetical protein
LVWFAIGDVSFGGPGRTGLFHEFGPYHVGPKSGYIVGGVATVVAIVAFGALVVRTRQGVVKWWWWAAVVALASAGSVGAFGWRVETAGVVGANIGGGFAMILGPLVIAGLLVLAVWFVLVVGPEVVSDRTSARRRHARRWASLLTVAALLVAPGLYAVEYALIQYQNTLPYHDDTVGLITPRQYAEVRLGQTRAAVQKKLGPKLPGFDFQGFPPQSVPHFPGPAPQSTCDHYLDSDYIVYYQFCFRRGVLVSKASARTE